MLRSICQASIGLLLLFIFTPLTLAQTTMTYQGQLQDGANLVDGETVELLFELYDNPDPASGILVSSDGPFNVAVENGLFQVDLDFGDVNYTVAKYLRIRVNGTWLAETQEITSVPMAQYALGAGGVQWTNVLNAPEFWRLGGNAGTTPGTDFIGTTDESALELHVGGHRALRLEPEPNGHTNVIGGSGSNTIGPDLDGVTINGGDGNRALSDYTTISGGRAHDAEGYIATIGGGEANSANGNRSTIGGGANNTVHARFGVIAGGGWTDFGNTSATSNVVYDQYGTIGGGGNNRTGSDDGDPESDTFATVGGGRSNAASGSSATVGGGFTNEASGTEATVGGGNSNSASGTYAAVPGGLSNDAVGDFSFAAGTRAHANHKGAFVWADSEFADFSSSVADEFAIRAAGGVRLVIGTTTCTLGETDSGFTCSTSSAREAKTDVEAVSPASALARVAELPLYTWRYRNADPDDRHMGPMAGEFAEAFGLGDDKTRIHVLDLAGVALAAVQGLHEQNRELREEVVELREVAERNAEMAERNRELEQRLAALEAVLLDDERVARSE